MVHALLEIVILISETLKIFLTALLEFSFTIEEREHSYIATVKPENFEGWANFAL